MIEETGPARETYSRREILLKAGNGLGAAALGTLVGTRAHAAAPSGVGGFEGVPHLVPRAKRVIYLFMSGGPSSLDMFDYKETFSKIHGTELPDSIRGARHPTELMGGQATFPCVAPMFDFERVGKHGTWVSELLPHTKKIVDEITIIKSMNTDAVTHDTATSYINTGSPTSGCPAMGAWLNYGLGSLDENMPPYVVMVSKGKGNSEALPHRLWGSGFLPPEHQGVKLHGPGDYEFPQSTGLSGESKATLDLYGEDVKTPGTFAANCLRARRMAERGVRFIQLFHSGWDQHSNLPTDIGASAKIRTRHARRSSSTSSNVAFSKTPSSSAEGNLDARFTPRENSPKTITGATTTAAPSTPGSPEPA